MVQLENPRPGALSLDHLPRAWLCGRGVRQKSLPRKDQRAALDARSVFDWLVPLIAPPPCLPSLAHSVARAGVPWQCGVLPLWVLALPTGRPSLTRTASLPIGVGRLVVVRCVNRAFGCAYTPLGRGAPHWWHLLREAKLSRKLHLRQSHGPRTVAVRTVTAGRCPPDEPPPCAGGSAGRGLPDTMRRASALRERRDPGGAPFTTASQIWPEVVYAVE